MIYRYNGSALLNTFLKGKEWKLNVRTKSAHNNSTDKNIHTFADIFPGAISKSKNYSIPINHTWINNSKDIFTQVCTAFDKNVEADELQLTVASKTTLAFNSRSCKPYIGYIGEEVNYNTDIIFATIAIPDNMDFYQIQLSNANVYSYDVFLVNDDDYQYVIALSFSLSNYKSLGYLNIILKNDDCTKCYITKFNINHAGKYSVKAYEIPAYTDDKTGKSFYPEELRQIVTPCPIILSRPRKPSYLIVTTDHDAINHIKTYIMKTKYHKTENNKYMIKCLTPDENTEYKLPVGAQLYDLANRTYISAVTIYVPFVTALDFQRGSSFKKEISDLILKAIHFDRISIMDYNGKIYHVM